MPQDTLTGWTLEQLIIELADAVGSATLGSGDDNSAVVPTDPNTLDQLTRAVNRGYKSFLSANPRWTFLERVVQFTLSEDGTAGNCIDGDPGRYALPSFITGNPKGDWTFVDTIATRAFIMVADEYRVRRARDRAVETSGVPVIGCVRPLSPAPGGVQKAARHEFVCYPNPDDDYVIQAEFRISAHEMTNLTDRHIAGAEHDLAILEQAVWQFKKLDNPAEPQPTAELAKSIALDSATRTRSPGEFVNTFQTQRSEERLFPRRTILVNDEPI